MPKKKTNGSRKYRNIQIFREDYETLENFGKKGESFAIIVSKILKKKL